MKKTMNTWIRRVTLGAFITMNLALGAAEKPSPQSAETHSVKPDWSKFDWDKLNAQALAEYTRPVRPGIPGKFPFLNVRSKHHQGHMYAPNFDFGAVPGAKHYRFTVAHWDAGKKVLADKTWVFEAPDPWASLAPVWTELPVCLMPGEGLSPNRPEKTGDTWLRLTVEGLDGPGGKPVGKAKIGTAEMLEFRKAQPFQGPLEQPKTTLREACLHAIRQTAKDDTTYQFCRDYRLPIEGPRGPALAKFQNVEGVFIHMVMIVGSTIPFLAKESKDPDEVAMAIKTARNAADTIINTSTPPDWKYGHFPLTLRNRGKHWNAYLAGEKTYEEWLADMHAQSAGGYVMTQDCRTDDIALWSLDVYDVTKDAKYLDAAKRLAATWRDTQLPSGIWPFSVKPVTGEKWWARAKHRGDYPPALTIWFLDRLATQYGVRDYEQTADRAFNWVLENQVKPLDLRAHFHDAGPGPRSSQGALAASEIAMVLFNRAARDKNAEYTAMGEEIVRWIEDWFIRWEADGTVLEQSRDRADVAFTAGGVVQAYVKAHEMTGNPLYLAKALRMANRLMGDWVNKSGYGWSFYSAPRAAVCLLEAYPYLKKHNLPGGE